MGAAACDVASLLMHGQAHTCTVILHVPVAQAAPPASAARRRRERLAGGGLPIPAYGPAAAA